MAPARDKTETADFSSIPPAVQRRLLRFINRARLPEDLLRSPQQMRDTSGEHGHANGAVDDEPDDERDEGEERGHTNVATLRKELAIEIIRRRPPFGYMEIDRLLAFEGILDWLRELLRRLRAEHYGEWSEPYPSSPGDRRSRSRTQRSCIPARFSSFPRARTRCFGIRPARRHSRSSTAPPPV